MIESAMATTTAGVGDGTDGAFERAVAPRLDEERTQPLAAADGEHAEGGSPMDALVQHTVCAVAYFCAVQLYLAPSRRRRRRVLAYRVQDDL